MAIDINNILFSQQLLAWYDCSARSLPWRKSPADPYAVWVSEIMLQQTTVAAVIPFFNRWMQRFPTVQSLAEAQLDEVLHLWASLGYYARARNLHKGAQYVVACCGGEVPRDLEAVRKIPGIGPYTAGALLSIAYDLPEPIVDANIVRVLARVHAVTGDPKSAVTSRELWRIARAALPHSRVGDFNQSLMELGALVCHPADPRCSGCPVSPQCRAFHSGEPTAFPEMLSAKKWLDIDDVAVAVADSRGRVLVARRSPGASLWGGLWELPRATREEDETLELCAARALREGVGLDVPPINRFTALRHVVANRRVTLYGFTGTVADESPAEPRTYEQVAWVAPDALGDRAFSSPQVRLLAEWRASRLQRSLDLAG